MWVVEKWVMIDHRHHLAPDKWENVFLELAIHHTEPVFVRRCLPLLNPFKVYQHERHAVVFRIDQQRLRWDLFAAYIRICFDLDWRDIRKVALPGRNPGNGASVSNINHMV